MKSIIVLIFGDIIAIIGIWLLYRSNIATEPRGSIYGWIFVVIGIIVILTSLFAIHRT